MQQVQQRIGRARRLEKLERSIRGGNGPDTPQYLAGCSKGGEQGGVLSFGTHLNTSYLETEGEVFRAASGQQGHAGQAGDERPDKPKEVVRQ